MVTSLLAWRYAFSKSNRHRVISLVIMGAIAIGIMAIIIILSVMNSLQDDILDNLKSVESFQMHVSNLPDLPIEQLSASLSALENVNSVFPFVETRMIIQNEESGKSATGRIRAVPPSLFETDNPFSEKISLSSSSMSFTLIIGYPLYNYLDAETGGSVSLNYLGKGNALSLTLKHLDRYVSNVYQSPISEFNESTIFVPLDTLLDDIGEEDLIYGLFLQDDSPKKMKQLTQAIQELYPESTIQSWQEIHGPFYSALLLEIVLMYLFLIFMFFIVALNLKNATVRLIHAKQRELAILRALGATKKMINHVIISSTTIISALGVLLGSILGMVVSCNLRTIFLLLNRVFIFFTGRSHVILSYPIKSEIAVYEILAIAGTIILLTWIFTYVGSRKLLSREPMEMLWHE